MKHLQKLWNQHRFRLLVLVFVFTALVLGLLVAVVEARDPRANITSFEDGIWWSVTTMTGVGYGDVVPVTTTGRILGVGLQVMGVVVLALIVAHISVELFGVRDRYYWNKFDKRMDLIEEQLVRMEKNQRYLVHNQTSEESKKESHLVE